MNEKHDDPFRLSRFVEAQAGVYEKALAELRAGAKRSHWMWFIFPQIEGLGTSAMAQRYAIASRDEAIAYLNHPTLGTRLRECAEVLLRLEGRSAEQIMGYPDYLKLRSSMTLFAAVAGADSPFKSVLEKYFGGEPDEHTVRRLAFPA